jgi:hypothetical protein
MAPLGGSAGWVMALASDWLWRMSRGTCQRNGADTTREPVEEVCRMGVGTFPRRVCRMGDGTFPGRVCSMGHGTCLRVGVEDNFWHLSKKSCWNNPRTCQGSLEDGHGTPGRFCRMGHGTCVRMGVEDELWRPSMTFCWDNCGICPGSLQDGLWDLPGEVLWDGVWHLPQNA